VLLTTKQTCVAEYVHEFIQGLQLFIGQLQCDEYCLQPDQVMHDPNGTTTLHAGAAGPYSEEARYRVTKHQVIWPPSDGGLHNCLTPVLQYGTHVAGHRRHSRLQGGCCHYGGPLVPRTQSMASAT
jgi:hypothetical protein